MELRYGLSRDDYIFGWLDLNHIQYVERLNNLSSIFVTGIDLLDDAEEFKICTGYSVQSIVDSGESTVMEGRMPATLQEFEKWKPKYEKIEGWQ